MIVHSDLRYYFCIYIIVGDIFIITLIITSFSTFVFFVLHRMGLAISFVSVVKEKVSRWITITLLKYTGDVKFTVKTVDSDLRIYCYCYIGRVAHNINISAWHCMANVS